jgi:hypothetical protein
MANATPPLEPEVQAAIDEYVQISIALKVPPPPERVWDLPDVDSKAEADLPGDQGLTTRKTAGRKSSTASKS